MYSGPIFIASDHAGYQLKKRLLRYLESEAGLQVEDLGAKASDPDDDYPDYIAPAAKKAVENDGRAILICGSGNGACISANKIPGMRAALGYNIDAAILSRTDEDANGLCLAGRLLSDDHALAIVKNWLNTDFSKEERHARRIKKIIALEK